MLNLYLVLIFWCASTCYAIRQQLIIYTGENCTGDGLLLQNQHPRVVPEAPLILSTSQSYTANGLWVAYANTNFKQAIHDLQTGESICYNGIELRNAKSIRHLGPSDMSTPSISFFEDVDFVGRMLTVTASAAIIPFTPKSLFSTAWSNWTFYSGANFDGIAHCFLPQRPDILKFDFITQLNTSYPVWRSVRRDCHLPEGEGYDIPHYYTF